MSIYIVKEKEIRKKIINYITTLNMKRIILAFATVLITSIAFCQEPTTLQKENLKGKVLSVRCFNFAYSENFGSPTEGELRWVKDQVFDAQGRVILFNSDSHLSDYFLVKYEKEGNNTIAELTILYSGMDDTKYKTLNDFLNQKKVNDNNYRAITYNSDNIVTKYDVFERFSPATKFELDYRKTAKSLGNGTYECKLYDKSGQSFLNFKEIYNSNGQLTDLDNERQFNRVYSYDKAIVISDAGKYQYNNKGQLVSYTQQKNSFRNKKEYVYNDQGDIIQKNTLVSRDKSDEYKKTGEVIYKDYKYDENGNWVCRMVSDGKKYLYIEKRQIEYCNTSEEIESKVKDLYSKLPVIDIKAVEEFADFFKKNLDRAYYTCQIPLIEYDSKYSSVKNADKASVVVTIHFDDYWKGKQRLRLTMPDKYYSKLKNVVDEIQKEEKECEYVYKDRKLIMNNEEYVIDTSTGEMKNITRNFTLRKE